MRAPSRPLVAAGLFGPGCTDECKSLAPAFQLDIRAGRGWLDVIVEIGDEIRGRTFNLGGVLDDATPRWR